MSVQSSRRTTAIGVDCADCPSGLS
ncbi:MAG: hypothetical protein K2G16_04470 [Lachnospiraceae bacterium]|nr:hypothetical protein [Lachnospiraceae bacterium]